MTQYNIINGTINDFTTTYTLSADKSYKIRISQNAAASVEVLWASLDAEDATAMLKISQDGENTQDHPTASSITLSGTNGVSGWQTDKFIDKWLHVSLTKNSNTSGTVRLLLTTKQN